MCSDEPVKISVPELAAKMSDEQRCAAARALVLDAYRLVCPKQSSGNSLDPVAIELATFMNGAVAALLRTQADWQIAQWWASVEEQERQAAHGLH
jgi:hypothetical protein